jgi:hypothetical protein
MRRSCRSSTAGELQQLVVRDRAPQEERQPRGELDVAQPVGLAGGHRRGIALDAPDELRTGQDALQRELDAALEPAILMAAPIELHQARQIAVAQLPTEGAAAERRHDAAGTGFLVGFARGLVAPKPGGRRRTTRKHLPPARRIAGAGGVERSGDREAIEVRPAGHVDGVDRAAGERLQLPRRLGDATDPAHGDHVRPRLQRHAHAQATVDFVAGDGGVGEVRLVILLAAEIDQQHAAAVDGELGLVGELEAAHRAEVGAKELGADDVFAVERQRHPGQTAAEGADRHAIDLRVLRPVLPDDERLVAGNDRRIAHRQRAQPAGGVEITLEEQGRRAQQVGDVVEPVAGLVGRQERHWIDLEIEQVANGVGVLDAVEPVHHRPPRVRLRCRLPIER